jgi:hypothetical protein
MILFILFKFLNIVVDNDWGFYSLISRVAFTSLFAGATSSLVQEVIDRDVTTRRVAM